MVILTDNNNSKEIKYLIRKLKKKDIIRKLWYLYSEVPQCDLVKELHKVFDELEFQNT